MSEDRIVYILVARGGGIDGRDHTDNGGDQVFASFEREAAEKHSSRPWCDLVPTVVDVNAARQTAMAKLSPVDRLMLGVIEYRRILAVKGNS